MSADNGIYILETQGPEYRVAYAHAIENIFNYPDILRECFDGCEVFTTKKKAIDYAAEILDYVGYVEYGISVIDKFYDRDYYSF